MVTRRTQISRKKREAEKLRVAVEKAFREGVLEGKAMAVKAAEVANYEASCSVAGQMGQPIPEYPAGKPIQEFITGATRDLSHDKYDYEGFLSPTVIEAFGAFMHANRQTAAGLRDSDNWQKGIPFDTYMKSLWRHFHAAWKAHRHDPSQPLLVIDLLAVMFNAQGYLHEYMKLNRINADEIYTLAHMARAEELKRREAARVGRG